MKTRIFMLAKGKTLDATQEMIAVGVSNVLGCFVGSMAVTGSFTRTAVNDASGVKTPLGGAVTGTMVLLALALLTSTFQYIPKATLAAVVICAMIYLFDVEAIITLWKTKSEYLLYLYFQYFELKCNYQCLECIQFDDWGKTSC